MFPPRDDCQKARRGIVDEILRLFDLAGIKQTDEPSIPGVSFVSTLPKSAIKGGNNPPVAVWRFPSCCQHLVARRRPAGRWGYKGRTERRTFCCWRVAECEIDRLLSIELEARAQKKEDMMVLLVCRELRCEKDRDFAGR
jgi:hypothetical protein